MDMSKAAFPAISGTATKADESHPLYREWRKYEASCRANLINGQDFKDWLYQQQQAAKRNDWSKHPQYPSFLIWMRETKAGGRKCKPTRYMPYGLSFPENFKAWLEGERW